MVKFEWSTFWIVLVSCFGVMIFSYLIDPYFLGVIMIVLAISITGVWCISLLRRIFGASGAEPKHERRGGASQ